MLKNNAGNEQHSTVCNKLKKYWVIKKIDSNSYVYISWNMHDMWIIHITFEREIPMFSNIIARTLACRTAVQQHQLKTKWLLCCTRIFACIRGKCERNRSVLSVAQASQPVERAENLEYRNQLCGVCWGAVYCSNEYIYLNHPVLLIK